MADQSPILTPQFPLGLDASLREQYQVMGYIYDIYDGDTVYYHASLGYNQWAAFQIGRLLHIDTPEVRPLATRNAGLEAKRYLASLLLQYALNRHQPDSVARLGRKFLCRSHPASVTSFQHFAVADREKYGRWLVELVGADDFGQPVSINELMLNSGLAVPMEY